MKRKRVLRSDKCSPISKFFKKAPPPASDPKGKEVEVLEVISSAVSPNKEESENCSSPNKGDEMHGQRGRGRWSRGGQWNDRGTFQNHQGNQGFQGNQNQQFQGRQGIGNQGGQHQNSNFQQGMQHGAQQHNSQFQGVQQQNSQYRGQQQQQNRQYQGMQQHNQENVQFQGQQRQCQTNAQYSGQHSNTIPVLMNQRMDNRSEKRGDELQNVYDYGLAERSLPPKSRQSLLSIELEETVPSVTKAPETRQNLTDSIVCERVHQSSVHSGACRTVSSTGEVMLEFFGPPASPDTAGAVVESPSAGPNPGAADVTYNCDDEQQMERVIGSPEINLKSTQVHGTSQSPQSSRLNKAYFDKQRSPGDLLANPEDNHHMNTRERKSEYKHDSESKYQVSKPAILNSDLEGRNRERDYRERSSRNEDNESSKYHVIRSSSEDNTSEYKHTESIRKVSKPPLSNSDHEGRKKERDYRERNSRNGDINSSKYHHIRSSAEYQQRKQRYSSQEPVRTSSLTATVSEYKEHGRKRPRSKSQTYEKHGACDYTHKASEVVVYDSYARHSEEDFGTFAEPHRSLNNNTECLPYRRNPQSHHRHDHSYPHHWPIEDKIYRNIDEHVHRHDKFSEQGRHVRELKDVQCVSESEQVHVKNLKADDCTSPPLKVNKVRNDAHSKFVHPKDHSEYAVHSRNNHVRIEAYEKSKDHYRNVHNVHKDDKLVEKRTGDSSEMNMTKKQNGSKPSTSASVPVMRQHNVAGRGNRRNYIDCSPEKQFRQSLKSQASHGGNSFQGSQTSQGGNSFQGSQTFHSRNSFQGSQTSHGGNSFQSSQTSHGGNCFQGSQTSHAGNHLQGLQASHGGNSFQGSQASHGGNSFQGSQASHGVNSFQGSQASHGGNSFQGSQASHGGNSFQGSQASHGGNRIGRTLLPTQPYPTQTQQYSRGGGSRGGTSPRRGMLSPSRSPGRGGVNNNAGRGVTTSSSLRVAEQRARRPRHSRVMTRGMQDQRHQHQRPQQDQGLTTAPYSEGAVDTAAGGDDRLVDWSQLDAQSQQGYPQTVQPGTQRLLPEPPTALVLTGQQAVLSDSGPNQQGGAEPEVDKGLPTLSNQSDSQSTPPEESSINELLNDLSEEESHEPLKMDCPLEDPIDTDKCNEPPSRIDSQISKTVDAADTDMDKLESKFKDTVLENRPATPENCPTAPDNRPATPSDESENEFDLEEIEVVPTLSQGQGQSGSSSGLVTKDSEKGTGVAGESVQKGLQNLRNIFKGRMSPASSCSGVTPLGEAEEESEKEDSEPEKKTPEPLTSAWNPMSFSQGSDDYAFDVAMSDDDVDSDDDDLLDAPSILQIKKPVASSVVKPKPLITPSGSEDEAEVIPAPKPDPDEVFSLDTLLTEREQKEKTDRQFAELEAELQEDIRHGGIRNLAADATDEMMPDHRLQLKSMEMVEQVICDHHPGDLVFDPARYERTFSYPGTLTLQSCGFIPGSSHIDKHLSTLEPELMGEMLTSEVIEMCFCAISTPHAFLTWLFQLISVHDNCLVAQQSQAIIYRVLRQSNNKARDWVPDLATIKRVFVNMGADDLTLCPPRDTDMNKNQVKSECGQQGAAAAAGGSVSGSQQGAAAGGDVQQQDGRRMYKLENLRLVLHVIADAVHLRSSCYKVDDLVSIMVMVFQVSLDKRLNQQALDYDIEVLLSSLLYAIPTDKWSNKLVELCRVVPSLTSHHHNMQHLASLLPPCERGRYLQRRLAYAMLHHRLLREPPPDTVLNFKLHHLHPLLAGIVIKGDTVDYYLMSSLISLVDLAVGNEDLVSREKNDLVTLMNILKNKMGDVRESISIIDRTMVKDQMVRLCSKWTFLLQNMGSNERTIFAYTTVSEPVKIESVVTRDHADSDPEELDSIPME